MAYRRSMDSHLTPAQAEIHDEIDGLMRVLRVRANRDKLDDQQFSMATSMVERWKWNSRVIQGDDLRHFLETARKLVDGIKAYDMERERLNKRG